MTMFAYVLVCISLAFSLGGADDKFNRAVSPCFELFEVGKCSTADFDGALECINDLDPTDFSRGEKMGLISIRNVIRKEKKTCDEWINGPNPNFNVVTEPCFNLYDKGQCESANFEDAIECISDVMDSGKFPKEKQMEDLAVIKSAWQQIQARCEGVLEEKEREEEEKEEEGDDY